MQNNTIFLSCARLFGKIVLKNAEVPEDDATWREMYKFPTTVSESLEFYGYIKKILIKKNETEICKDGCYLLLTYYNIDFYKKDNNNNTSINGLNQISESILLVL